MTRSPPSATTHWHIHSSGKTIFLNYALARLISARQVVLMCNNSAVYLFYHGQVYSRQAGLGFEGIPTHKRDQYCPMWALIDVDYQDRGPRITSSSEMWPIQASSPHPARWKLWRKQYRAAVWGMPLWTMGELREGYAFNVFSSSPSTPAMWFDRG